MTGLAFDACDDEFCDLDLLPDALTGALFLDSFEMGEFDKLMPWVERCRERGINFAFFADSAVKSHLLPAMLADLRACYGEIAMRKPFPTPGEPQTDAFLKMVCVLESAIETGRGVVATCD